MSNEEPMERGFKYDRLTVADDGCFEATRDNIFACPCGHGRWVSVQTGRVYRGHGGNEREQWSLQAEGPWVRILEDSGWDEMVASRDSALHEQQNVRKRVAKAIGAEL